MVLFSRGRVAEKRSSQILSGERIPRLTSRSCGEFPVVGRTLPSRHCLRIGFIRWFLPVCGPTLAPLARFSALSSDRNSYPSQCLAHRNDVPSPPSPGERVSACPPRRTLSPANRGGRRGGKQLHMAGRLGGEETRQPYAGTREEFRKVDAHLQRE